MTLENNQRISLNQFWRTFLFEAFLFSLTLGLGIAAAVKISEVLKIQKIVLPQISFWSFIVSFLLSTLFIFLIIRFLKFKKVKGLIFKIIFVLAAAFGGLLFFEAWFPEPIPFVIIIALILWWWEKPLILNQDTLMIFGLAGAGSALGLAIEPLMAVVLLIIFSIYDFIAVYKTKHMIEMAKEMIEEKTILALVIPSNLSEFKADLKEVKPGGKFLILGGGDIVFPLLFSASLVPIGILNSLIVALFSLIGLFVSSYIFIKQKVRAPIPALPPIALFSIIGFLISLIL